MSVHFCRPAELVALDRRPGFRALYALALESPGTRESWFCLGARSGTGVLLLAVSGIVVVHEFAHQLRQHARRRSAVSPNGRCLTPAQPPR